MSNINVFVKIDTAHRCCFNLSLNTTIIDLKQRIFDKEGQEVLALVYRTKPLRNKSNNGQKELTLRDYDMQNNATIFASMRLLGGAQDPNLTEGGSNRRQFDSSLVNKLGAEIVTKCNVCLCTESNIKKAKLKCGLCQFCADCMIGVIDNQLTNGCIEYWCNNTGCGRSKGALSYQLAYAICAFSTKEINERDLKLDKNGFQSPMSVMSICPNSKCQRYIFRQSNKIRVKCDHCQTFICWFCKHQHQNSNKLKCGNPDCDIVATYTLLLDNGGTYKQIDGIANVWSVRLCPGPNCIRFNEHKSNCRRMTCSCGYQYCHICLQKWSSYSHACEKKGKQVITAQLLGIQ